MVERGAAARWTLVSAPPQVKGFGVYTPGQTTSERGFNDCAGADRHSVILHDHLFKNAGSTIDWALRQCFGEAFVEQRDRQFSGADFFLAAMRANPALRVVSTHQFRPPLPEIPHTRVFTLMMFRDPLERAISVYHFNRRRGDRDDRFAKAARAMSLRDYIDWSMQPGIPSTLCNFHIAKCLDDTFHDPSSADGEHLEAARRYIDSVPLVGLVDRFDDSMVLFEHLLREAFPSIDLSYVKRNAGPRLTWRDRDKANILREAIGETLFGELRQRNAYDLEVLSYVRETFQRRIGEVPGLEHARADFRSRCRKRESVWSRCRRVISERIRSI